MTKSRAIFERYGNSNTRPLRSSLRTTSTDACNASTIGPVTSSRTVVKRCSGRDSYSCSATMTCARAASSRPRMFNASSVMGKVRPGTVALRHHGHLERPRNVERRIVPTKPGGGRGMVLARYVVAHLGRIFERLKTVRESLRNEQHPVIVLRQLRGEPTPGADVDDDVVHRAAPAAHQLGLGVRSVLIVNPSHGAAMRVERDGGLHDVGEERAE